MDLNIFQQKNNSEIISKSTDTDKLLKITSILCDKRKVLEKTLTEADNTNKSEDEQTLRELIEEMKTFGISEIDYQKYLAIQAQVK
ncbi:hypothetical protein K9M47_03785 [Candidatus Gracilibacteria bacterium]|nr:hypothetical protein [Candidatus Gracilibacteria bacterium]MCF7898448.1 hypothetical protein [Candidatus Paceibacterota bacterium]